MEEWTPNHVKDCVESHLDEVKKDVEYFDPEEADNILKGYRIGMGLALTLIQNHMFFKLVGSCTRLDLQWINPTELIEALVEANEETKLYEGHLGKWGDLISKYK